MMVRFTLVLAVSIMITIGVSAEPTPPVMPKVTETPMPPPVELPAPPVKSEDVPEKPITAEEAVEIALQRQPDVMQAQAGLSAAQGREKQVRSGLFPNLGLSSGYNNSNSNTSSNRTSGFSSNGYQASATLKQLIFDFYHTRDLTKQAQALEKSAGANVSRVRSDITSLVKQAFYSLQQNERLVVVNESNLKNRQNHLDLAKARLNAGMGLPADVVRAETALSEAVLNLNLVSTGAAIARMNLAELMGVDPRTPIKSADSREPDVKADDLNKLVEQALNGRPEVVQAQMRYEAAGHGLNAARTANMPSLSASAGYLRRGVGFPLLEDSASVNLSIQFSPFDAGLAVGRMQEAGANQESAQADLESIRLAVINEVSKAYLNLKTAEQRVKTADAEVANAEEGARLTQGRYSAGLGTFLDVLDAQAALLTANTNRVNAQTAVEQAKASLVHALGTQ